jgi:very-short-patch-repair endonuclease
VDVTCSRGRLGRPGIRLHQVKGHLQDETEREGIPVTSVARTLFDLAEVVDARQLEKAFEEADRLGLLKLRELEALCERSKGRKGLRTIRALIATAHEPAMTRSRLEQQFAALCHRYGLPRPVRNVRFLGREADVVWPRQKLIVELDGFAFHRHRAAFERDRTRDARLQAAGYRVIRLTHRRLEDEPATVVEELRRLLES